MFCDDDYEVVLVGVAFFPAWIMGEHSVIIPHLGFLLLLFFLFFFFLSVEISFCAPVALFYASPKDQSKMAWQAETTVDTSPMMSSM